MAHVITQVCCNDGACVDVCPVQCIRPRPDDPEYSSAEQLYIDPSACIDCGVCQEACPVGAIYADYDLPAKFEAYPAINADHFRDNPIEDWSLPPLPQDRAIVSKGNLRVAIIGTGPSACYAAAELLKVPGIELSIFERLPTPFGLVRSGVAPDHQQTKLFAETFADLLHHPAVRCFFNVEVGRDLSLSEVLSCHHAVVYAGGAAGDKSLGLPGEDLPGSHSAREFVAWYNGHPDHAEASFDLSGERAVIIGNGNVALDVARMLAQPVARYATTDLADHAREALEGSLIREVVVAARRGAHEAAYSTGELLALSQLDDVILTGRAGDLPADDAPVTAVLRAAARASARRKWDAVCTFSNSRPGSASRRIALRFLMSPMEILGSDRVEAVRFARHRLVLADGQVAREPTGEIETIATKLVIRAAGYRGEPVPGLPFDDVRGVIPNRGGRVWNLSAGEPLAGLYVAGWIKRGPSGLIGTNRACSRETTTALLDDFSTGRLTRAVTTPDELDGLLRARGVAPLDVQAWSRVDAAERAAGAALNRPRSKFVRVTDMLASATT
ncbi:4Fe-4S binding protein [Novosphingobium sp. JCM 18896]|uniref:4Fe-4S binding protein n=1 Tax=Novosphingobium sp. JCM 18896 TaxID=2989731 RepID=UPI00222390BA|nr:4Fe-4S binding protein [Novosphingobium sp. JCM 18896]MCW1432285.1 4Fe-4S binding protein [Novosphingobium sp. JCM 18896]